MRSNSSCEISPLASRRRSTSSAVSAPRRGGRADCPHEQGHQPGRAHAKAASSRQERDRSRGASGRRAGCGRAAWSGAGWGNEAMAAAPIYLPVVISRRHELGGAVAHHVVP